MFYNVDGICYDVDIKIKGILDEKYDEIIDTITNFVRDMNLNIDIGIGEESED